MASVFSTSATCWLVVCVALSGVNAATKPEDAENIYVDMIKSFDPLPVSTEYLEGTVAMEKIENPIGSVNGLSNINGLSLATTETDEQLQVTGTFTSTIRVVVAMKADHNETYRVPCIYKSYNMYANIAMSMVVDSQNEKAQLSELTLQSVTALDDNDQLRCDCGMDYIPEVFATDAFTGYVKHVIDDQLENAIRRQSA